MRFRWAVVAISVIALVFAVTPVGSSPAHALATGGSTSPSDYIVSTPSSVLAGAASGVSSSVASAGQLGAALANKVKFDPRWTALASKYGSPVPNDWIGVTSADQATITQMEKQFAVPATKTFSAAKGVGSAVGVFAAVGTGLALGPKIDSMFGVDDTQGLCGDTGNGVSSFIASITGIDCDTWAMSQELQAQRNQDAAASGPVSDQLCIPSNPGFCVQMNAFVSNGTALGQTRDWFCWSRSGAPVGAQEFHLKFSDGYEELFMWPGQSSSDFPSFGCSLDSSEAVRWEAPGYWASHGSPVSVNAFDGSSLVSSSPVTTSSADPERYFRCTVTLADSSTLSADSGTFHESQTTPLPIPVSPAIPHGDVPVSTQCFEMGGPVAIPMSSPQTTTAPYQAWKTAYPNCGEGSCQTLLYKGTQNCFTAIDSSLCDGWATDPNKTDDYSCTVAGTPADLSECNVYGNTFNAQKVAQGNAYADPATGLDTGDETSPSVDQQTFANPVSDPDVSGRQCFGAGWGAQNPVEWVFKPITCALQWAFVPSKSDLKANGSKMRNLINSSAVGSVLGILSGIATFSITGGGCQGLTWNFSIAGLSKTVHMLAACPDDPLAPTASVVKTVLTAVVVTAGVLASARYIAGIFGYVGYGGIVDAERRQEYRDQARESKKVKFK